MEKSCSKCAPKELDPDPFYVGKQTKTTTNSFKTKIF